MFGGAPCRIYLQGGGSQGVSQGVDWRRYYEDHGKVRKIRLKFGGGVYKWGH